MKIGVLGYHGDVIEHIRALEKCKVSALDIRTKNDLKNVNALIIPGGESTTMNKLLKREGLDKEIIRRARKGMPIYGTCAGAILVARKIMDDRQKGLGLIDIEIRRNDYGRQVDSFEKDISIKSFKKPFHAVFIRAPVIKKACHGVEILAKQDGNIVMARQKNILVTTFHPELTEDLRVHRYFIGMINSD